MSLPTPGLWQGKRKICFSWPVNLRYLQGRWLEASAWSRRRLAEKGEGSSEAFSQRQAIRNSPLLAAPTVSRRGRVICRGEGLPGMFRKLSLWEEFLLWTHTLVPWPLSLLGFSHVISYCLKWSCWAACYMASQGSSTYTEVSAPWGQGASLSRLAVGISSLSEWLSEWHHQPKTKMAPWPPSSPMT